MPNNLTRGLIGGFVLALLGVGMFLLIFFGLSSVAEIPRLVLSLCVPPALIGVVVGGYLLFTGKLAPKE